MELKEKYCVPCEGGVEPLGKKEIETFIEKLEMGWNVVDNKKIRKEFSFKNFRESMNFANEIASIAENEKHHPDLGIHTRSVEVELSTHAINGLSENDFILAAKIDDLLL